MTVYSINSPSSTRKAVQALRKHASFLASFALTPQCCYHIDPLDEALHLRPCHLFLLEPVTFANPYPFTFKTPTSPGHHDNYSAFPLDDTCTPINPTSLGTIHENQEHPAISHKPPSSTTTRRRPKPHRSFLQCWLPSSFQMQCFFTFNDMISLPRTNIIIPFAILRRVLPYTYECSCSDSTPFTPFEFYNTPYSNSFPDLLLILSAKIQPSPIPTEVSVHPPSNSKLQFMSTTTIAIPKTLISRRPPRKPPHICHYYPWLDRNELKISRSNE